MRKMRGLTRSTMRLIMPPLPAASRPSKMIDDAGVRRLDPVLELDQLNLQLENFGLVLFFANLLFAVDVGLLRVAVQR